MGLLTRIKAAGEAFWKPSKVGFGPGEPIRPAAPAEPARRLDYQVARNIQINPRAAESRAVTFSQMRALADINGVLRTVIEKRKDEIKGLEWDIAVKPEFANQAGLDDEVKSVKKFWEKPDLEVTFDQWLNPLLEDILVIDAPCLFKERDRLGRLRSLQTIDGSTINILVNDTGRVPKPPQMAYEQIIQGFPRTGYIRPVAGSNVFPVLDPQTGIEEMRTFDELYYRPYNVRSNGVLGFSHVESIIMTVNIALRRDTTFLEHFRSGNIPAGFIPTPPEWTPEQVIEFTEMFNTMLEGDLSARSKLQAIPGAGTVQLINPLTFDALFDEWLARIICARFGVSPMPYVRAMNRATAETMWEASKDEALVPMMQHLKAMFDDVIQRDMGKPYLQFIWTPGQNYSEEDARQDDLQLKSGVATIDELREKQGKRPYDNGIGSRPMVWTGSGPVPLTDIASGAFKPSFGGMTNPQDFQLSLGQESETVPDQDFELSIEPEEENSYELSIRSIKAELKAWERFETGHIGKKSRPFETKAVPPAVASLVQGKLRSATTIDEVKSVFESVRQTLGRRKRTPVVEGSLVDLMREYESVLKPIMRETQEKVSSEKPL